MDHGKDFGFLDFASCVYVRRGKGIYV